MQNLLLQAVDKFFSLLYFLILIRIILSWIPGLRDSGFGRIIYELTEPILGPIRHMLDNSPIGGGMMLDFSPIIALFIMKIISIIIQAIITAVF
jgi:YggT family protein